MKNKFVYLIGLFICFFVILYSVIFASSGFDIISFTTYNLIDYPIIYIISFNLLIIYPLYYHKNNYFEVVFSTVLLFNLIINYTLIASFSHIGIGDYFFPILMNSQNIITALTFNIIIALFIAVILLIMKFKDRKYYLIVHVLFLIILSIIHLLWFLGVKYESIKTPNLFEPRPFDFIYQLLILLKGGYLFISSVVILYVSFNSIISKMQKIVNIDLTKLSKILVWFFFGFFGIERLFEKTNKWIFHFQILSAALMIGYYFTMNTMYFNIRLNMLFFVVFIVSGILKILVSVYSLVNILKK